MRERKTGSMIAPEYAHRPSVECDNGNEEAHGRTNRLLLRRARKLIDLPKPRVPHFVLARLSPIFEIGCEHLSSLYF
jgi:hypothetical protein